MLPDKDPWKPTVFQRSLKRPAFLHGKLPFPDPFPIQVRQKDSLRSLFGLVVRRWNPYIWYRSELFTLSFERTGFGIFFKDSVIAASGTILVTKSITRFAPESVSSAKRTTLSSSAAFSIRHEISFSIVNLRIRPRSLIPCSAAPEERIS